jgi:hypothetical protein
MTHTLPATLDETLPTQSCPDSSSGQVRQVTYDDLFAIAKFAEETLYGEIPRGASLNHFLSQTAFGEKYQLTSSPTYHRLDATTLLTAWWLLIG